MQFLMMLTKQSYSLIALRTASSIDTGVVKCKPASSVAVSLFDEVTQLLGLIFVREPAEVANTPPEATKEVVEAATHSRQLDIAL